MSSINYAKKLEVKKSYDVIVCGGGVAGVAAGQTVTVFGDTPSADEVADLANTISYELICGIGKRVPRIHLQKEETV